MTLHKERAGATTQPALYFTNAEGKPLSTYKLTPLDLFPQGLSARGILDDLFSLQGARHVAQDKRLAALAQHDVLAKKVRHFRSRTRRRRAEGKTVPLQYLLRWRDAERRFDAMWWEGCRFVELLEADWISYHPGKAWGDTP